MSDAFAPDPESGRLLQLRDESAWEALMRTHQQALFRLAYLMLGDAAEADDVAQDALIRAYHAIDSFDVARPILPWLLAITANLARNRKRGLARFTAALRRLVLAEPERITPAAAPVEAVNVAQDRANRLWHAVRLLPTPDQEVIYLRHFLALSEAEAAAALNIPQGTVKSRTSRALTRLRDVVVRDFPDLREPLTGDEL